MAEKLESAFDVFGDSDDSDDDDESAKVLSAPTKTQPKPHTILERITISLSVEEIESKIFSPDTISRAASCIRVYGIVIIKQVFDQDSIARLGEAALSDFKTASQLAEETGIGKFDWKFQELACREEQRYELRRCPQMNIELTENQVSLSNHPGIFSILQQACAAPNHSLINEPDSIIAGDVGVFVSLPGACNQRWNSFPIFIFLCLCCCCCFIYLLFICVLGYMQIMIIYSGILLYPHMWLTCLCRHLERRQKKHHTS